MTDCKWQYCLHLASQQPEMVVKMFGSMNMYELSDALHYKHVQMGWTMQPAPSGGLFLSFV